MTPTTNNPLTFTPGKFYRTRDGRKAQVLADDMGNPQYPMLARFFTNGEWSGFASMTRGGRYYDSEDEANADLIAEWRDQPEADWSKMPEGAVALAQWRHDGPWIATDTVPILGVFSFLIKDCGRSWELYPQHVPKWSGDWRDSLVTRPTEGGK